MKTLRIGIVGCGEVTQIIHLPSLYQLADRFQVTALCDVSRTVLDKIGDQWQVAQRTEDYRELVSLPDVDAVLVTNPHAYHSAVTLAAVAEGKHVLVEKPMCLTLREADEISAAAAHAGVVVQVGYMRRYAPAFVEACQRVRDLGKIRLARVHDVIGANPLIIGKTSRVVRGNDISEAVKAEGAELQERLLVEALGEDALPGHKRAYLLLLGLSTHDISAMRELLGMPRGVIYARWHDDLPVDAPNQPGGGRYITAAFDYGGYTCHFETGVDTIPRFDGHLEVFGDDRVLKVQYDTPYVRNLPIRLLITEADSTGRVVRSEVHPRWGDAFVEEWIAFHTNVTEGRTPKTTPADFRQDLELFLTMMAHIRGQGGS